MKRDWTDCQNPPPSWNKNVYDCDESEPILTTVVRKCYLNHLKCTLEQNYALYSAVESEHNIDIQRCVFKLERKALRKCMVASLYQKAMLSMINNIKLCTSEQKLYANIHDNMDIDSPQATFSGPPAREMGPFLTPPADYPTAAKPKFNQEIHISPDILNGERKMFTTNCIVDSTAEEVKGTISKDPASTDQPFVSESAYDWNQIEKEMARVCGLMFNGSDSDLGKMLMEDDSFPDPNPLKTVNPVPSVSHPGSESYDWEVLRIKHEGELRKRWEELGKTASLERQANIKRRIVQLFGEDELALADASSDMSEKAAAQYREQIAPWIVKHLMPLYKEKRIASRVLFKKLARHIADCLILRNRSPDECDVWMGVQEFFQNGKGIMSEADIFS